jgi:hypothetical protein
VSRGNNLALVKAGNDDRYSSVQNVSPFQYEIEMAPSA